jgi:aspartyl-tRNA(Asn)/glutamyl-tRNA(Gln) amidotransferase subunit C
MKITAREVRYVAGLARLELTPGEEREFTAQLNAVLEYMDQLNELDTAGVEPTAHVLPLRNVLREDEVRPSLPVEEVLGNAPEQDQDHFVVPKIIE